MAGDDPRRTGAGNAGASAASGGAHRLPDALRWCGPLAVGIGLGTVLVTAAMAPWFAWTANALSDLGAVGEPTAPIYNWGLIVTGAIGCAYLGWLARFRRTMVETAGLAVIGVSLVALSLVGVYNAGRPNHGLVSAAFFFALTYGLFLDGSGRVLAGDDRLGLAAIWFGVAHATAWTVAPWEGVAIPEFVGACLLSAWVLLTWWQFG